jgi:hypothetical protein
MRLALLALSVVIGAASACASSGSHGSGDTPLPSGDEFNDPPVPDARPPDINNDDSGAFGVGSRGRDAGSNEDAAPRGNADASRPDAQITPDASADDASTPDASVEPDASTPDASTPDSGIVAPADACNGTGALSAGDLAVVEVMIASQSGSGDRGEWFEVQSTRACSLNLNGLHVESPRGTGSNTLDITTDVWLAANGMFVVADSADPATNHSVPMPIFTWAGAPADVLANSGDTITLTSGGVTVESFTYPQFQTIVPGTSISFPSNCAWSDRSSWARWSYSFNQWTPGFYGTPNADNTDVTCY